MQQNSYLNMVKAAEAKSNSTVRLDVRALAVRYTSYPRVADDATGCPVRSRNTIAHVDPRPIVSDIFILKKSTVLFTNCMP